jgi:peptidase M28-like protein
VPTLTETTRQILSLPREAGTAEADQARRLVIAFLTELGYTVSVQRFAFAPSSLRSFPIFGAGLGCLALLLLPLLASYRVPSWAALTVWASGLLVLTLVATGVAMGWVSLGEAIREDANLIATRGDRHPRRWVVAHLDSKAQAHSMAGRLVAVWSVIVAVVTLTALALLRLGSPIEPVWLGLGSVIAILAGFLAGRGRLQGRSPGARDNGTGVVAALSAAASTSDPDFGVLITGAEEFGLVGARVFARLTRNLGECEFVNVDTVDQEGYLYLVSHNVNGQRLAQALQPRLAGVGVPIRSRRLPLGIFVDSAPLSRVAHAITIGRLTWRTLQRIHTPADTIDDLSFETAERVGRAIVHKLN